MNAIKEIRENTGMNRADFSKVYNIPIRTLEDWEAGRRKCPEYVVSLLRRVTNEDIDNTKAFKLYANNELMKELGACYRELLKVMREYPKVCVNLQTDVR